MTHRNAVTQSVSDLQDMHLPENYVAKPDDWGLVDDLQEYVEGKVGTANPPIGLCTLETQI